MSQRKRIWGWFFYDWACQPFYTLMLTFFFAPYFATVAADFFISSGMETEASKAKAQTMWSICLSASGLFIGISAPILGAIADTSGRRMPWIYVFSIMLIVGSLGTWVGVPDGSNLTLMLYFFALGYIGTEFALIFTNAQLTTLGSQSEIGKISGSGFGFGYLGGVFALAIALLFLVEQPNGKTFMLGIEPLFGFLNPEQMEGTRFVGPLAAIWFVIFAIPYFRNTKDDPTLLDKINIAKGLRDLVQLLKGLRARRSMSAYLVSSMFYRDAMSGLYSFGGVYAALVLDWTITQLGVFGIIAALGAALFSWLGGKADSLLGPKPVITFCIYVMIIVCITIVGMTPNSLFGIQLADGSTLPDTIFMICGVLIGGFGGAMQAASRTMMVRHTTLERATEAFGLYGLMGRATAFLAPTLIGIVTAITQSPRIGVSPLIGLFIIGLIILMWVDADGESSS